MIVFSDDAPHGADEVGGKAAALMRLDALGFAPPAFFVILPEAFHDGVPVDEFGPALKAALARLGRTLSRRAGNVCELSGEKTALKVVEVVTILAASPRLRFRSNSLNHRRSRFKK